MPKRLTSYRDPLFESARYAELQRRLRANLVRLRKERAWSQRQAAESCGGMSFQHYSQLERGITNLTFATLCRLADGFDVDVVDLIGPKTAKIETPRKRRG